MLPINLAIVDDEEIAIELFNINFKDEVRDGKFVLDCFTRPSDLFDFLQKPENSDRIVIILSDINMPEMDGFQVLEKVKNLFPTMKVYMESAYDHPDYIKKALDLGADDYLVKPIDYDALKGMLLDLDEAK